MPKTNGGTPATSRDGNDMDNGGTRKSRAVASPLDDLNKNIVRILEQDGRAPFKEIATSLGVSEGTIRNRVAWMKQSGMLKIVAIADPTAFQYRADAMLGIKISGTATPTDVAERLSAFSEVVYVIWVSGRFDLLIEVVSDTEEGFLEFLETHLFSQPDIGEVEIMSCLSMFKNQFLLKRDLD